MDVTAPSIRRQDIARFYNYDALIERFTDDANHQRDFFEDVAMIATDITDLDTLQRFFLGDAAALISACYSENRLGEWAKRIKRSSSTIYEYRQVARFYPSEARKQWITEPVISWSHMRYAMRMDTLEAALEVLEEASALCWSVDKTAMQIKERKGIDTAAPLPRITPELADKARAWQAQEKREMLSGQALMVDIAHMVLALIGET